MMQKATVAPEYCSFYIAGVRNVSIPFDADGNGLAATQTCINVGCLYWNDGDTTIVLGPIDEVARPGAPSFDGILETPDRVILLFDANLPDIMHAAVPDRRTRVRIWKNHKTEPDEVVIGFG